MCLEDVQNLRGIGWRETIRTIVAKKCIAGVVDVLEFEARKQLVDLQKEDIINIGRLVVTLCCRQLVDDKTSTEEVNKMLGFMGANYSEEIRNFAITLLNNGANMGITDVGNMICSHMIDELDMSHSISDAYESTLASEFESGRGLRLLLKLGFVNERPEYGMDKQWSETGDRYVLKLFRDFVFHQCDENGNPMMDLGHVVSALNKLDTGDSEKIALASRDGQAILVVSYCDVMRALEGAYEELISKNNAGGNLVGDVQGYVQQPQQAGLQYMGGGY